MKRLLILVLTLLVRVPLFAVDIPINGNALAPTPSGNFPPRVATAGSQALAVQSLGGSIVGTRIDVRGNLIDARPFQIFHAAADESIAIATDGVGWVVAAEGVSLIAHVDADGRVETHPWPYHSESYSIAFSGSVYVVTYVSTASPYAIHAATLTREGEVIADRELPFSSDGLSFIASVLVTEPNRALIVFSLFADVYISTFDVSAIDGNGTISSPLRIGTNLGAIGWNGSELILTYKPDDHIHVRRLNGGAVTAGPEFVLPKSPFQILWTGTAWFMAYHDISHHRDTFELRDVDGSLIREMTDPSAAFSDVLAPAGGNRLFALTRDNSGQSYVHTFAISDPAQRTEDVLLSRAFPSQTQLQVARCGDEWRAVWIEGSNVTRLLARRFALSGTPRGDAVTLADSAIATSQPASIACTSDSTMVTWEDDALHVHAASLGPDGLPRRILDLGKTSGFSSVATNGTEYVISFAKEDRSAVEMQRLSLDGIAIGFPASYTAFDLTYKLAGVVLAPVGDEYVGVVIYSKTTALPY